MVDDLDDETMERSGKRNFSATRARDSGPGGRSRQAESGRSGLSSPLDDVNRQIIKMLQEDGRRTFSEMAVVLNVSEGTIRNRVHSMRESGQMRIAAIVDPGAVEYTTDAMICLKVAPSSTPADVAGRLADYDEVVYILWVSGRFDLLVEVVSDEHDQLLEFLHEHIYGSHDIAEVETLMGLKNFKNQFLLKRNWT